LDEQDAYPTDMYSLFDFQSPALKSAQTVQKQLEQAAVNQNSSGKQSET
jgi:hypothetical protein